MNPAFSEFVVPDGIRLEDVRSRLLEGERCEIDGVHQISRIYLDSFDWRLYQAGGLLEEQGGETGERVLMWRDCSAAQALDPTLVSKTPGLIGDLPTGPLRDRVAPALAMRTLLPMVRSVSSIETLRVLDDESKTVVRVELESNRYSSPDGKREGTLSARVRLLPVRGYPKPLARLQEFLERDIALPLTQVNGLLEALEASGRRPLDYSSKLNYKLSPQERADAATKHILIDLLNTLEANIPGSRENLDSEFLHDLRVATRRTRSALTQIRDVFNPEVTERFKEGFAWVQEITGPVRDLDVYLLSFDDYRASLPEPMRPFLEPFRQFLVSHYGEQHRTLVRQLNSPRLRTLLKEWREFIEAPVPEFSVVPNAMRPVRALADERTWKIYRRVIKEGRAIRPDSAPEELHELRKSCKKLRYLMEFFESLYPGNEINKLVKILKGLLDNLGNFQDLAVQADSLRHLAQQMEEEGVATTDAVLAMGVLVGDLYQRQRGARIEFAEIFAKFDVSANDKIFRDLFLAKQEPST